LRNVQLLINEEGFIFSAYNHPCLWEHHIFVEDFLCKEILSLKKYNLP